MSILYFSFIYKGKYEDNRHKQKSIKLYEKIVLSIFYVTDFYLVLSVVKLFLSRG